MSAMPRFSIYLRQGMRLYRNTELALPVYYCTSRIKLLCGYVAYKANIFKRWFTLYMCCIINCIFFVRNNMWRTWRHCSFPFDKRTWMHHMKRLTVFCPGLWIFIECAFEEKDGFTVYCSLKHTHQYSNDYTFFFSSRYMLISKYH